MVAIYNFTPAHAVVGGVLLGSASVMRMWLHGQILGVSGICGGVVRGKAADLQRWCFGGGLVASGLALQVLFPTAFEPISIPAWREVLGGLAVGMGSALGNGCTSGHGLQGNARLSKRSMVFTATFMATGFCVATMLGSARAVTAVPTVLPSVDDTISVAARVLGVHFALYLSSAGLARAGALSPAAAPLVNSFLDGTLFGMGLGIAGMTSAARVVQFLDFSQASWNPTLMCVMVGGLAVITPFVQGLVLPGRLAKPLLADAFALPTSTIVDRKLLVGGVLFGTGWGISGMCPGPAIVNLASPFHPSLVNVAAMAAAVHLSESAFVQRLVRD